MSFSASVDLDQSTGEIASIFQARQCSHGGVSPWRSHESSDVDLAELKTVLGSTNGSVRELLAITQPAAAVSLHLESNLFPGDGTRRFVSRACPGPGGERSCTNGADISGPRRPVTLRRSAKEKIWGSRGDKFGKAAGPFSPGPGRRDDPAAPPRLPGEEISRRRFPHHQLSKSLSSTLGTMELNGAVSLR